MGFTFNALEIFEMAQQIERNGIQFYHAAAKNIKDKSLKQTFSELADMEALHEIIFRSMKEKLSEEEKETMVFDPDDEIALYLQAMVNGRVFDVNTDIAKQLTGSETIQDILKMAIQAEKDSIAFYLGIRDFVPVRAGRDKVEAIIKEEMGHIATLNQKFPQSN